LPSWRRTSPTEVDVRTWVEDFRRVRSQRRYEMRRTDGTPIVDAVTDWVLVETASGKLRRIPAEMETAFGTAPEGAATSRTPWAAPAPPPAPCRAVYPVRFTDLDSLVLVNNAAYLDHLLHAGLDARGALGWGFEALVGAGAAPLCVGGDVEYVDMARLGDGLAITTWFTPEDDALGVHQTLAREADGRLLVQSTTRWGWRDPFTRAVVPTPDALVRALAREDAA
jgi:acyl-CoA thioesterase FadM